MASLNKGGRPKGVRDSKPRVTAARKVASDAAAEGILPAEIMLRVARHLWDLALDKNGNVTSEEKAKEAALMAEKAAPYYNARLSSTTLKGDPNAPLVHRVQLVGPE